VMTPVADFPAHCLGPRIEAIASMSIRRLGSRQYSDAPFA
jgi:hypothetical protein